MSRTAVFAPLGFCIASKSSAPFSWRRCSSGLPNLPAVPFQVFDEHIDITKMFSGILLLGLNYKIKLWNMVFFFTSYASSYSYAYFVWQDNVYCLKNKQKFFFNYLIPRLVLCIFVFKEDWNSSCSTYILLHLMLENLLVLFSLLMKHKLFNFLLWKLCAVHWNQVHFIVPCIQCWPPILLRTNKHTHAIHWVVQHWLPVVVLYFSLMHLRLWLCSIPQRQTLHFLFLHLMIVSYISFPEAS